ncbi:MAG: hypothetical protein NC127_05385 [Muribaculum sp.]|nr:hypothetical protein [Muribaculum sp.]
MKSRIYSIVGATLAFMLWACSGGDSSGAILKLVAERDSIKELSELQMRKLDVINEMISTINSALDSISAEENMLFINPSTSEIPISRNDALRNLERYERVLQHQQQRIASLDKNFVANGDNPEMQGMIEMMRQQLAAKDNQIAKLKEELSKKNVDIARLQRQVAEQRTQIDRQTSEIEKLDQTNKAQEKALVYQDDVINSCYVILGSKKDLERRGIVKKKQMVPESALDKTKFAKVDIRKWREITFEAKRPRILTSMPTGSYTLSTNGNGTYTLRVSNPGNFWSVSNFLVIQTD